MALLNSLKLVAAKRNHSNSPVQQRRNKMCLQLNEQIELARAQLEGRTYAPTKTKKVVDEATGEKRAVETTKRVKQWWWVASSGKLNVAMRYGARVVEIAKGKNAVEVADGAQLVATLELLKEAVAAGELDEAIEVASSAVRKSGK